MGLRDNIKIGIHNSLDWLMVRYHVNCEKRKYKDPRRVSIYESVHLTEQQQKQIDDLYLENYGHKIPNIWHRHFTAFTGNFDPNYFPEMLFGPEFETFMNVKSFYGKTVEDKNFLPYLAELANVKMPEVVLTCTEGVFRIANKDICSRDEAVKFLEGITEPLFVKPSVDSCSGRGCRVIQFINGLDAESKLSVEKTLSQLGSNFTIQKRLKCHSSIARIYSGSVNTFRVITYRWKDAFKSMPVIMRIGQAGSFLDNAHAGGMFIGVSADGKLREKAFTEFKTEFTEHPDTHLKFNNIQIEHFDQIVPSALKMHEMVPQLGIINWDFTINENGEPVLIEANVSGGSIWLIEMAHGVGGFGEDTPQVLRWLRKMKSLKASERAPYYFGYGVE